MTPQEVEEYRRSCVRIEPLAINEEYVRTPADIAFWSDQYAVIYREWQLAKFDREKEWGQAVVRARQELQPGPNGGKAPTVGDVEAMAITDHSYVQAKRNEILLEAEKVRLGGMMEALKTKRDMLVSLGAHLRSEHEQGLYLRDHSNG